MKNEKNTKWLERFREQMHDYMQKNNKNQTQIAKMLGVTRNSVCRLLNGQTAPNIHKLELYVKLFEIDMNVVFHAKNSIIDSNEEKEDLVQMVKNIRTMVANINLKLNDFRSV